MEWTGETDLRLVSDVVVRVEPEDDEIDVEWIRWIDGAWLRGAGVCRMKRSDDG